VLALQRTTSLFIGELRLPFRGDEATLSLLIGELIVAMAILIYYSVFVGCSIILYSY
jgi:hypothetical protein